MIDWSGLCAGQHRMPCPTCDKGPRDTALSVKIDEGGASGVATCFRCGYVENWLSRGATRSRPPIERHPRPVQGNESALTYARALLSDSEALSGTVAERYLRKRGCAIPPDDGAARYHPHVWHAPSRSYWPALIGIITDAATGALMGIHRTYLTSDGLAKAPVSPQRMILGKKQGGVIRLWPDEAVATGLGVAEGIETALSLALAFRPVWALIDAGNLAAFQMVGGIDSLTIAVDHDTAGLRAAKECATRWSQAGREIRLVIPPNAGEDLNDVAREAA